MSRGKTGAFVALIAAAALCWLGLTSHRRSIACKQRDAALTQRLDPLRHRAHDKLKVGTKKDDVIRFFADNGIPLTIEGHEASGTVRTLGCAPLGCGTDDFLIGVRVGLDDAGSVKSEPDVGGIYTNCL